MTMAIDLYYNKMSNHCRTVMLAAKQLNIELNLKEVNFVKGEHLAPEYLKLNPQHTVPTMVDDGFVLTESRAIITYLANKYGKNSTLYPQEPQARALVDQRLFFDMDIIYKRFCDYAYPMVFAGAPCDEENLKKFEEALGFLETFLERSTFVAGPHLTLADISIVVNVSNFSIVDYDLSKYPKIKAWFDTMKTIPGYHEANETGRLLFQEYCKTLKK